MNIKDLEEIAVEIVKCRWNNRDVIRYRIQNPDKYSGRKVFSVGRWADENIVFSVTDIGKSWLQSQLGEPDRNTTEFSWAPGRKVHEYFLDEETRNA